jgi:hypothetical protein
MVEMQRYKLFLVMMVCMALVVLMASCKKSDSGNPAGPDNPVTGAYGTGSISFYTNSSVIGNYSLSGSFNPTGYGTSGTGLMCYYDVSSNSAWIYAYKWTSSTNWDWTVLSFNRTTSLGTGTYSFAENEAMLSIIKGASGMSSSDGTHYIIDEGTANMTSFSTTGMKGNFGGTGLGVSDNVLGLPIQLTNGSFDVTFGTTAVSP